jgi:hypothetical protein
MRVPLIKEEKSKEENKREAAVRALRTCTAKDTGGRE